MSKKTPANTIQITPPDKKMTDKESIAWALVNIPIQAAITANAYLKEPFTDCLNELTIELQRQVKAVNRGDMRSLEGLLVQQAHILNFIFDRLAQRAINAEYLPSFEVNLRLALRAQAQCARTLETLSTIKNPPVVFARQANVATNQQINVGTQAGPPPASQPATIAPTPQIEHTHGQYLDAGTATAASGENQAMATLGEIHRTADA